MASTSASISPCSRASRSKSFRPIPTPTATAWTDAHDAFPNDPNETTDTDNDGTGDNADDFDNDPNETTDSDGDGVGDNGDAFPGDPLETTDSDGDGAGDNADAFDNDPTETTDTDGDGVGNNADAFDNDPTETKDTDGDGHGDNGDLYPTNPAVWSNQAPVAVNDAHTGQWNTVMNIAAPGVKANDSDLGDGAAVLTVSQVAAPSHGALTLNADGSFTYKPVANYAGTDSFTYKLTDPFNVQSNIATVVLTITSPCAPKKKKHHHHYKGDGDDHDRGRNGHRKGDRCDHDRDGDGHRHDDDDDDDDDDVVCAAGMPKTNKDNYSMKQWSTVVDFGEVRRSQERRQDADDHRVGEHHVARHADTGGGRFVRLQVGTGLHRHRQLPLYRSHHGRRGQRRRTCHHPGDEEARQ